MKSLIVTILVIALASVANASLVSHWAFDENEGNIAYDSANGHNGTISGATWTTGKFGGALDFDGIDDFVGTLNNIFSNAQLASGATLAAWFKTDSTDYGYIADIEGYMNLGINHIYAPSPDKLEGMVDGGTHRFFSGSNVNDNIWHHAAIVWDGTNTAILYLDGVNVSSGLSGPPKPDLKTRPFTIGAHASLNVYAFYDGLVDDVRVYNHALSPTEIRDLIPEPATLLLLGLGGLFLKRRRC